ncbi:hypothetical protein [Herbaspirillum camelliae]|uniref:hypothetical protein n=1 Tax=Herbaspirillum camelliae TaxID=1892903 RepID=UPI000949E30D|nr:hypothetical protein [Herbaspirillum camelliae]
MGSKNFAEELRTIVEGLKEKGQAVIDCDALIAYLRQIESTPESEPSALQMEQFKAQLQERAERARQQHEGTLEAFRSVITSGQAAIKSAFLLNGGAAVAMLAFIGHMTQGNKLGIDMRTLALALAVFAGGVLTTAVQSGFTYLTQWFSMLGRTWATRVALGCNLLSIALAIFSYGFFVWGVCRAYKGILTLG